MMELSMELCGNFAMREKEKAEESTVYNFISDLSKNGRSLKRCRGYVTAFRSAFWLKTSF